MSISVEHLPSMLEGIGFRDVKLLSSYRDRATLLARTVDLRSVVVKVLPDSAAEVVVADSLPPLPGLLVADKTVRLPSGHVALVTPYQVHGSLRQLVEQTGPLQVGTASAYLTNVAATLEQLHDRGLAHGDLKPENILVRDDGSPVLIDFGSVSGTSSAGIATGGTPPFAAPELSTGRIPTPATDVYALGMTLYFLLSGEEPGDPALAKLIRSTSKEHDDLISLTEALTDVRPDRRPGIRDVRSALEAHSALIDSPPHQPDAYEAIVSFEDHLVTLSSGSPLAIAGRRATELPVGTDDPAVSRAAIEFRVTDGRLAITNLSRSNTVHLSATDHATADVPLESGASYTAARRESVVTLTTSSKRYMLSVVVGPGLLPDKAREPAGTSTWDPRGFAHQNQLTSVQLRLLTAYCLPLLRGRSSHAASHTEVARKLNLSTLTTRNQMQRLTRRLAEALAVDVDKDAVCRAAISAGLVKPHTITLFRELDEPTESPSKIGSAHQP